MFMTLQSTSRRTALLFLAVSSFLGVACAGESAAPTYTSTDIDADTATAVGSPAGCATGETRSCKVFLGQHGDLSNCVPGLDVCSAGEWTGCIDEASFAENPELLSQLTAE